MESTLPLLIEIAITKQEYLTALKVIRNYRKQKGRTPTKQWLSEHPGITVRLMQLLAVSSNYLEYQFIEDFTEEKFFKLRNAGKRSWDEFNKTVNHDLIATSVKTGSCL